MHPRLFDMLQNTAHKNAFAITNSIHIQLRGAIEKLIHQKRCFRANAHRLIHIEFKLLLIIDNPHPAATKHIARAHQHRIADLRGDLIDLLTGGSRATGGLKQVVIVDKGGELLPIFGHVDRFCRCADNPRTDTA